ncbi:hypothetical protein DXG01_000482, partial [Tephrocybe rancida]
MDPPAFTKGKEREEAERAATEEAAKRNGEEEEKGKGKGKGKEKGLKKKKKRKRGEDTEDQDEDKDKDEAQDMNPSQISGPFPIDPSLLNEGILQGT